MKKIVSRGACLLLALGLSLNAVGCQKSNENNKIKEGKQCPYCKGEKIIKFGFFNGHQRFRCKNELCKKTFTGNINNPFRYSKKFRENYEKYFEFFIQGLPLRICAAKTGTTNDNKDVWFVGYSKYYTTAVWVGYDMPKVINDGYGNTCSGNIWKEFMAKIHDGLEIKDFVPYVTEDGILSNGEEISESQPAEETAEETTEETAEENTDETTENEENSIYTNKNDDETTTISTDNNSDNRDNRDNTETTNPYNSQVTKPSNEQAPGGADGGVYQEYWGD